MTIAPNTPTNPVFPKIGQEMLDRLTDQANSISDNRPKPAPQPNKRWSQLVTW